MATVVNLLVSSTSTVVNVIVAGGIIVQDNVTVIDGFLTSKGTGNTGAGHEVGDKIVGWINDTYVAGEISALPVSLTNINSAISGTIFT